MNKTPVRPKAKVLQEHALFKSDNLDFLVNNRSSYADKVDFIYLDPVSTSGKPGKLPTVASHQHWVDFMRPRLVNSLPLLKSTGVIAISIDDSEVAYLRILMDEVFGNKNFIGLVVVDSGNVHNNARFLSVAHEYLLVYAKDLSALVKSETRWRQPREGLDGLRKKEAALRRQHGDDFKLISSELKAWLKEQPVSKRLKLFFNADSKGLYSYSDLSAPGVKLTYPVIHPATGKPVVLPSRGWGLTEENFEKLKELDLIIWGESENQQPLKKLYLKDTPDQVIRSVIHYPARTTTQLLKNILGDRKGFESPKSLDYIKYIIETMSPDNAVVLDFFAGSGTTGHAVLDLNYENVESQRTFVLVSNNEKNMFTHVLKPRLERVISGRWADRVHRPRKAVLKTYE